MKKINDKGSNSYYTQGMTLAQNYGELIRTRRKAWKPKMTLKDLSARTGLAVSTINGYEQGYRVPRFEHAIILASVLGIDLNELVRAYDIKQAS